MRNIALSISGYFSNKDNDNLMLTNYIYDNIIKKMDGCNLYIFIHSFDIRNKLNILIKYPSVTNYIIENQIDFTEKLNEENRTFINAFSKENSGESCQNTLSYLYSKKQSIYLAMEYSKNNSINYHHIIWCRFDVGIRCKITEYTGTNPCHIFYDPNIENEHIYSPFWTQINAGYADYWFFSNPENMVLCANIYDYLLSNMFKLNSEFVQTLSNWPYSNKNNEFSNEILSTTINNEEQNTIYKFVNSSNNHLIYKFYFIKSGLFFKSKYIKHNQIL